MAALSDASGTSSVTASNDEADIIDGPVKIAKLAVNDLSVAYLTVNIN